MYAEYEKWELTDAPAAMIKEIMDRCIAVHTERIDVNTVNLTVHPDREDTLVDLCESRGISCRLL